MPIDGGVPKIEHGPVEDIHKRSSWRVGRSYANAQALILSPTGAVVHEIFSFMVYHFRSPKIGATPRVLLALIHVTNLSPMDEIRRASGFESIGGGCSVAV